MIIFVWVCHHLAPKWQEDENDQELTIGNLDWGGNPSGNLSMTHPLSYIYKCRSGNGPKVLFNLHTCRTYVPGSTLQMNWPMAGPENKSGNLITCLSGSRCHCDTDEGQIIRSLDWLLQGQSGGRALQVAGQQWQILWKLGTHRTKWIRREFTVSQGSVTASRNALSSTFVRHSFVLRNSTFNLICQKTGTIGIYIILTSIKHHQMSLVTCIYCVFATKFSLIHPTFQVIRHVACIHLRFMVFKRFYRLRSRV